MNERRWIVILTLSLSAAGCGGMASSNGGRAQTITAAPSLASTASSSAASAVNVPAQLRSLLLTVNDMPTGYRVDNSKSARHNDTSFCHQRLPQSPRAADASFIKGTFGPFIGERISDYGSASAASAAFDDGTNLLNHCTSYTDKKGERYTLSALSFPATGDRSFALHLDIHTKQIDGAGDVVYILRGPLILSVDTVSVFGDNPDLLATLAPKAYTRMTRG